MGITGIIVAWGITYYFLSKCIWKVYILGPACNEFGYYVHPVITSNRFFFSIKRHFRLTSILKSSVTMTSTYNEQIFFNKKAFQSNADHPLAHISAGDGGRGRGPCTVRSKLNTFEYAQDRHVHIQINWTQPSMLLRRTYVHWAPLVPSSVRTKSWL